MSKSETSCAGIEFTPAAPDEIDEVFALYRSAIEGLCRSGIDQWDELYPDRQTLAEDISKHQLQLGRIGGEAVCAYVLNEECDEAYAGGRWTRPEGRFCVVHRLCVLPARQNCGIGRRTMEHIEKTALQLGFEQVRLDTFTGNRYSIRLYERLGYRTVGTALWRKGEFLLMEKLLTHPEEEQR